jgi:hypothetical protein
MVRRWGPWVMITVGIVMMLVSVIGLWVVR